MTGAARSSPVAGREAYTGSARVRAVVSLLDAGVSSVGNLAISLCGAHMLDLAGFGTLSLLITVALLATGLSKVSLIDAFTLRYSARSPHRRSAAADAACGAVLVASATVGVVVAGIGAILLPLTAVATAVIALGAVLPCLLLQDAVRWISHADGRPTLALLNSLVWTVGSVVGALLLYSAGSVGPTGLLLVWGLTAGVAGLLAATLSRIRPRPLDAIQWVREARWTAARSGGDYALAQSVGYGSNFVIAALAGSAAFGALRIAQLPLAVVQVAITGGIAFLQPAMVRHVVHGDSAAARRQAGVSTALVSALVAAVSVVVMVVPVGPMSQILGDGWADARHLVPLLALGLVGSAVTASYGPYLRAIGQIEYEVRTKLYVAPIAILMTVLATWWWGVGGGVAAQTASIWLIAVASLARSFTFSALREQPGT